MKTLQMPPKDAVMKWLFMELMGSIDEDLLLENEEATATKLAKATPEEREALLARYGKAYEAFGAQWESFLAKKTQQLQQSMTSAHAGEATQEQAEISRIEQSFGSSQTV